MYDFVQERKVKGLSKRALWVSWECSNHIWDITDVDFLLIDWFDDWLIDWLLHWSIDWLIDCSIGPLIDWFSGYLIVELNCPSHFFLSRRISWIWPQMCPSLNAKPRWTFFCDDSWLSRRELRKWCTWPFRLLSRRSSPWTNPTKASCKFLFLLRENWISTDDLSFLNFFSAAFMPRPWLTKTGKICPEIFIKYLRWMSLHICSLRVLSLSDLLLEFQPFLTGRNSLELVFVSHSFCDNHI